MPAATWPRAMPETSTPTRSAHALRMCPSKGPTAATRPSHAARGFLRSRSRWVGPSPRWLRSPPHRADDGGRSTTSSASTSCHTRHAPGGFARDRDRSPEQASTGCFVHTPEVAPIARSSPGMARTTLRVPRRPGVPTRRGDVGKARRMGTSAGLIRQSPRYSHPVHVSFGPLPDQSRRFVAGARGFFTNYTLVF